MGPKMTEYLKMVPLPFWWQKLDLNELYHRPNLELACNVGSRLFFLRLGSTILYKKFQFFFTPYTPQKMTILAKFGHFGTFWYFFVFFFPPTPPKKKKKKKKKQSTLR